jgi:hypothetical protein
MMSGRHTRLDPPRRWRRVFATIAFAGFVAGLSVLILERPWEARLSAMQPNFS